MSANDFNVGSDTALSLIIDGQIVKTSILTSFEAKQMTTSIDSKAIDGKNRFREIRNGWEGNFEYDRTDSILDDFFAAEEANQYAGGLPPTISITQTITNIDQSITKYRFSGVALKYDSTGKWAGDAKVEPKLSWKASRRVKIQ